MTLPPSDFPAQPGPDPLPPGQSPPQYSSDGRWWWNGQQWVPNPQLGPGGKSKVAAGVLGILLGDFGAHKFYLGQIGIGILYLLFFWTLIPGIVGLVEGIIYLALSDYEFERRYGNPQAARQRPFF